MIVDRLARPMPPKRIEPYPLVDLLVPARDRDALEREANSLPSLQLGQRATADLEMLATGGFSPLDRFMGQADYLSVLQRMRLARGHIFPIPVTLPVDEGSAPPIGSRVTLRSATNEPLGVMTVEEAYAADMKAEARAVLGTEDPLHPTVAEMSRWGRVRLSGALRVLALPRHYDFEDLRLTPAEVRARLADMGSRYVVGLSPQTPLTLGQERALRRLLADRDAVLLIQAPSGLARMDDIEHFTRIRAFRLAAELSGHDRSLLVVTPLAAWMAPGRETIWQALALRNLGATHVALPADGSSRPSLEGQLAELGLELVSLPGGAGPLRRRVADVTEAARPARDRQGVCIWLTGLSGAGKSTTAEVLTVRLMEAGRQVTLLDGDVVRTHLSAGLGFSREDRDTNIRRIGFVAAEIVRHGGTVVCAAVSPYRATRADVRNMVGADRFIEVFVDTPLAVCEARDAKGMYARARRGEITGFTGIDDPYEAPETPDVRLDTVRHAVSENVREILAALVARGYLRTGAPAHH